MNTTTVRRFFPSSQAVLVHQDGAELTVPSTGVEIFLHTRENEEVPCCAELVSGDHYAEIDLEFDGKELIDFDGVLFLPREVGEMLTEVGCIVPQDCFA